MTARPHFLPSGHLSRQTHATAANEASQGSKWGRGLDPVILRRLHHAHLLACDRALWRLWVSQGAQIVLYAGGGMFAYTLSSNVIPFDSDLLDTLAVLGAALALLSACRLWLERRLLWREVHQIRRHLAALDPSTAVQPCHDALHKDIAEQGNVAEQPLRSR